MSAFDRYDYEITVNRPDDTEFDIKGSCYGEIHMFNAISQHCPNYTSAVIVFTIKRDAGKPE